MTTSTQLTNRIGAEQVHSAYRNAAAGMTATALGATLVAGILAGSGAVTWTVAFTFTGIMLLQIGIRLTLIFTYLRRKPPALHTLDQRFAAEAAGASTGGLAHV